MRSMTEVRKREGNVTSAPVSRTILHQRCEIVKPQIYLRNGAWGDVPQQAFGGFRARRENLQNLHQGALMPCLQGLYT